MGRPGHDSRLAAKGDVIVEVEVVEPGLGVLASLAATGDPPGKELQRFHFTVRPALAVAVGRG